MSAFKVTFLTEGLNKLRSTYMYIYNFANQLHLIKVNTLITGIGLFLKAIGIKN